MPGTNQLSVPSSAISPSPDNPIPAAASRMSRLRSPEATSANAARTGMSSGFVARSPRRKRLATDAELARPSAVYSPASTFARAVRRGMREMLFVKLRGLRWRAGCQPATGQALGLDRGSCLQNQQGGRTQVALLRSTYQTPPISVARSQFPPVAPGGDIGMVCPPIRTAAFTENQTVALPVPAGLAAVSRSAEILNWTPDSCKNPARQLRCEGTTVCSTA